MLSPYRVLDLTNDRGLICGQILADLGADVIAVEPPSGNPARSMGPFAGGEPDVERSPHWWAYSRNKRGITLDLDSNEDREKLKGLVTSIDIFVESYDPGHLAERGLGYDELAKLNPSLVYVSITPFGQDGPKAGYAATDLIVQAAGGNLVLQGDDDRPPLRLSVPQAFLHAGAEAAGAALIALHERQRSGHGQHVDVSAQQAVNQATFGTSLAEAIGDQSATRFSGGLKLGPIALRLVFPAKDGFVAIALLFGTAFGPRTSKFMEYVCEEGACEDAIRDQDWVTYVEAFLAQTPEAVEMYELLKSTVENFTKTRTKEELLQAAAKRGLLIAPVATIADVAVNEQLIARDYWQEVEHQTPAGRFRYPGPFAKISATPITYRHAAPRLGEHNEEILNGSWARPTAAAPEQKDQSDALPLADLKVLDFSWVMAGPAATRVLADYGATIVRVESTTRVDAARTMGIYQNGDVGPENGAAYHNWNAGKRGLTLDPTKEEGRAVALDLVRWADVVAESFSPKGMRGWGLDYESLRKVKPDLIMLSSCLMGQTGPMAMFAGYGNLSAAISGFYSIAGWPDRPPAGPFLAYTDTVSPRFSVAVILAALDHRRRTGEGQYIDQSQAEAALHFLSPAILDYTVNDHVEERSGNRDTQMAPHAVYPSAGDDCWVAIAVRDDDEWKELCGAMGRTDLAESDRFATAAGRLAGQEELDEIVAQWTKERSGEEVEGALQARGVPAHIVQNSKELFADPQLKHRGHFVKVSHPLLGSTTVDGSRFRLSRTPAKIERAGPTFGQDNQYVLETLLGYSSERMAELAAAGVLQ